MNLDEKIKIRVFSNDTLADLEVEVNNFIKYKNIKDIKFCVAQASFYACVIYFEKEG